MTGPGAAPAPERARVQARPPGPAIRLVLAATAAAALAIPAWVVTHPPALPRIAAKRVKLPPRRIVPPAELPPVEPVELVDLSADEARAFNASVPFSTDPNPAARPFRFRGPAEDLARALDCLAAAVVYEAGDDAAGERAVAQVVLNRLRHPAFPKTVCGVVFEGQERSTGCQFTFSCDGALTRWHPTEAAWRRARAVAQMALNGSVYRPVGYSTHYHTDWVVPYWQASLDKVAAVHSHLFFRWTGWWGTPPAFNRRVSSGEPVVAQLAPLSDAHKTAAALAEAKAAQAETAAATGAAPIPVGGSGDSFLVTLPPGTPPETYPALAAKACGERTVCKYSAWKDAARTPTALPLNAEQVAAMTYSYLRDRTTALEKSLWNCQQVPLVVRSSCMKRQVLTTPAALPTPVATPSPVPARGPQELDGVRRKAAVPEVATAKPTEG